MNRSSDNPPAEKTSFGSRVEEIDYLCENVVYWFWEPNNQRALHFADRLAALLGEPTSIDVERFNEEWAAIFDARGDTERAIQFADVTIRKLTANLAEFGRSGFQDAEWYRRDARELFDALYLQALRYLRIRRPEMATDRMNEASQASIRLGLSLDEDQLGLVEELANN